MLAPIVLKVNKNFVTIAIKNEQEKCNMFEMYVTVTFVTTYIPRNLSLVFATASYQSVRIWSVSKKQELLRIMVPNFSAAALVFSYDGKSIVSAWNDGVIRVRFIRF